MELSSGGIATPMLADTPLSDALAPSFGHAQNATVRSIPIRLGLVQGAEWMLGILLTATILSFLVLRATHAGALWRDECGTVQLAEMPGTAQIIEYFDHQTFPPLVPLIIRLFIQVFGDSDAVLRGFGFLAGLLFIGAAWFNARALAEDVPLFSLGLFGLSPIFLTWSTTVGGYGFGAAIIIVAFTLVAKFLVTPTRQLALAAFMATIASQQFVIGNLSLVLAITLAALLVALFYRGFSTAATIACMAGSCGLIGLFYLRIFASAQWRIVFQQSVHLSDVGHGFARAYGATGFLTWAMPVCFAGTLIAGAWMPFRKYTATSDCDKSRTLALALLVAVAAPILYLGALALSHYRTTAWHYLLLLAVLSIVIDTIWALAPRHSWLRAARLGAVILIGIAALAPAWKASHQRQTNIDVVAKKIADASPADLVVVAPWQYGISFNRYYHGGAQWVTLPNIEDHKIHRYDLILAKMISPHPIDDVLERVRHTLVAGGRVWVVGGVRIMEEGQQPLFLSPAPFDRFGWDSSAYSESWWEQLSVFIRTHGLRGQSVALSDSNPINQFENVPLVVVEGWQ